MRPNVIRTGYNESGLLERIDVWRSAPRLRRRCSIRPRRICRRSSTRRTTRACSASGDRYGNGVDHARTSTTRRRSASPRILTTRPSSFPANERVVQDLSYTYDPVGNVTRIRDDADTRTSSSSGTSGSTRPPTTPTTPLYRLVRATGREHLGQTGGARTPVQVPTTTPPGPVCRTRATATRWPRTPRPTRTTPSATSLRSRTRQRRRLDAPLRLQRAVARSSRPRPATALSATSLPGDPVAGPYSATYEYDAHGNTTRMPHLPALAWDERDRLRSTTRQVVNAGDPGDDVLRLRRGGIRGCARSPTARQRRPDAATPRSERLYLGAVEVYREFGHDGDDRRRSSARRCTCRRRPSERRSSRRARTAPTRRRRTLVRYQHTNHLGSALLELDAAAGVVTYEEYFPYGSTSYQAVRSQTDAPKRYRYTGKERDEESGLYYHGARYYAPWLGRWISCDPAGCSEGSNAFVYCGLRPSTLMDPDGKQPGGTVVTPGGGTVPTPNGPPVTNVPTNPPVDNAPPGGNILQGTPKNLAPRVAPRVGPRIGPTWGPAAAGVTVFLWIMLTDSNSDTDYTAHYTDPDTGQELKFRSVDELEGYKNRKAYEKLHAPGPKTTPVVAPPPKTDLDEIKEKIDPDKGPVHAPGPKDSADKVEAPATEAEPMPMEARELSKKERSIVDKQLKAGKKLTTDMKTLLRWEARWKWEQATGKKAPEGWQVHHIIPLEFAHLFPNMDPNDPSNLALIRTQDHQGPPHDDEPVDPRAAREGEEGRQGPDTAITADMLEAMRKAFLELWKKRIKVIK